MMWQVTRKTVALIVVLVGILATLPELSVAVELNLTEEEKAWLAEHQSVRVGVDPNFPPWEFIDENGSYSGVMPAYLEIVTSRLGIRLEKVVEPKFKYLTKRAKNKTIDLLPGLHVTPERQKFLKFTDAYFSGFGDGIFTRIDFEPLPNVAALDGRTVAMVRGHALAERTLKANPRIIPVYYDSVSKVMQAVAIGGADAGIAGLATASYEIRRQRIANLTIAGKPSSKRGRWHMGVRDDWPIFVSILNKALKSITPAEHLEIQRRWVNLEQPPEQKATLVLSPEEAKWLIDNPIVRVAASSSRAPIEFENDDGKAQGISIELLRWIEDILPITFEIESHKNQGEALIRLHAADVDMVSAVVRTAERQKSLRFTNPHISVPVAIFAGPQVPYVGGLEELEGRKVSALGGDAIEELLAINYPKLSITRFDTIADALHRLSRGEVDAYVGDLLTTSHYLGKLGLTQIKVVGETPYSSDFSVATTRDQKKLATIMQKALTAIPEADRSAIRQRWITFRYEQAFDYTLFWQVLIPTIVISCLILYWNRRLSSEVRLRRDAEEQLANKNTQLNRQNAELDAYAHTIAHGLKTPLAATARFLEILSKFHNETMSKDQVHLAKQASTSLEMGTDAVDALLNFATILNEDVELELLDMKPIVQNAIDQLKNVDAYNSATVNVPDVLPTAQGYAPWIGQVWQNYLSNALKYGEVPAVIYIGGEQSSDGQVRYWVRNNGRPLTKGEIEKLFAPFSRLHRGKVPGHGLGLTITQRIVEKLGGKVGAEPVPNSGNEFYFTLPATEAPKMVAS